MPCLFDDLVSAGKQCRWDGDAECFGGLEIECAAERHEEKKEDNNMK
jgi:hypothetical protein